MSSVLSYTTLYTFYSNVKGTVKTTRMNLTETCPTIGEVIIIINLIFSCVSQDLSKIHGLKEQNSHYIIQFNIWHYNIYFKALTFGDLGDNVEFKFGFFNIPGLVQSFGTYVNLSIFSVETAVLVKMKK